MRIFHQEHPIFVAYKQNFTFLDLGHRGIRLASPDLIIFFLGFQYYNGLMLDGVTISELMLTFYIVNDMSLFSEGLLLVS